MARSLFLSNSYLSVCLDDNGYVRDIFYPHVGLENHVGGLKHRIGVMIDGYFSWLDAPEWSAALSYGAKSLVGQVTYEHAGMNVRLEMQDVVYNELPIFIRSVKVVNRNEAHKDIKIFFGQEFAIGEAKMRNTAFYDPTKNAVVHYRGRRVFLVNGLSAAGGIDDYTVGVFGYEGKEGSWRDAEDGQLSKNAVEHGPADSVVRLCASCAQQDETQLFYWVCAAETLDDVYKLNELVLAKRPNAMVHSTTAYWQAWSNTRQPQFPQLTPEQEELYHTSLLLLRAHVDHDGGIIASPDSDMLLFGKDSYSYVWPRDGAYVAMALDAAGYSHVTRAYFEFCRRALHVDGYLHHKFQPDGSLGSTWHSSIKQTDWLDNRILQLPIQEDETATVLYALWKHYEASRDVEFIESLYKPFIERAADFMVAFRDQDTGLPIHSYDLWEEVTAVSTYTCCTVYGGLMAASRFCELLGKQSHADTYQSVAHDLVRAMREHLYDPELTSFVRHAEITSGGVQRAPVVDASSMFGLWYYDVLPPDDPLFVATQNTIDARLRLRTGIGGFIRYDADPYYRRHDQTDSNPWIITTLWDLQRRLKYAATVDELQTHIRDLQWVIDRKGKHPVLAEQFHPLSGESLSAMPLAWSHAEYVSTVLLYLRRLQELGGCEACLP